MSDDHDSNESSNKIQMNKSNVTKSRRIQNK